ncbi:MAG TPA: histidine triad nucleotide-binding protein [Gemmatimonadales bacterium]|nr:histidine triad nucleotide-binding protein [Gemmatimonadales bacterium]
MSDCLFCKIAGGEIPASIVSKNEEFLAFRDISPQAPTHILAIPVQHVASLNDVKDGQMLGGLMSFARDVAREAGLANKGYRVVANTNHEGGQTVNHLHLHILGGREMHWPPG